MFGGSGLGIPTPPYWFAVQEYKLSYHNGYIYIESK